MMEYERLTDEKEHYKKCVGCSYRNCQYCDDKYEYAREVHKRLAELEDKIEQGTLIEFPCKVGDTVYEVNTVSRKVSTSKARNLGIILRWEEDDLFGRWLFLTREEAEKRLKELQNG